MKREAVADRIVTYCDALVAFVVVNGLTFQLALGEPSIRCSIAGIASAATAINAFVPIAATLLLLWFRRYELRLRGDDVGDEVVVRFWRIMGIARIALVWFFAVMILVGIYAATQDTTCARVMG